MIDNSIYQIKHQMNKLITNPHNLIDNNITTTYINIHVNR